MVVGLAEVHGQLAHRLVLFDEHFARVLGVLGNSALENGLLEWPGPCRSVRTIRPRSCVGRVAAAGSQLREVRGQDFEPPLGPRCAAASAMALRIFS